MISRIFDVVAQRAKTDPSGLLLASKEGPGVWQEWTAADVWTQANNLAQSLLSLGIAQDLSSPEKQEKIAILSNNRPEWLIADLGCQLCGAVLTPVYPTIAPQELEFILKDAGVRIVFVADRQLYRRFKDALANAGVKSVFCFDEVDDLPRLESLTKAPEVPRQLPEIQPGMLATIIYTSGTTGVPKGVMLSHSNIVSNVIDCMPVFTFAEQGERALSFLPLNHIFERTVTYIYLQAGLSIWYAESMETIGDNLREVKPIVFTTVPRLLEKVYEKILAKGLELKGVKRGLFFWALNLARQYDNRKQGSAWYRLQLSLANKIIFSKWREALGGRVKAIVTGSAACQERLIRIFSAAGIVIMEGYGLTETSPVVSVNRYESGGRYIGSIGPLIQNVEVRLAPDGEILTRGKNIMMGYYKRPDLTTEVIDSDGWFHTGDVGNWVEERFLKITDRKKEIFKTSGGKYVAPQPVENKMKESPYIEQIMVVGANRKFTGALIVPNKSQVRRALKATGKEVASDTDLMTLPETRDLIRRALDKYNPLFGHIEQVKKFVLLPNEWTIDGGELTPSLKLKRKVIEEKYAAQINEIYGEA